MELIGKFDKGFSFLLCVIDIFSKYRWAVCLTDKKSVKITEVFQKILNESRQKSMVVNFTSYQ